MDVILDGESNFELKGNPQDVFSAVVAIEDFLRQNGRAMLSVKADGMNIMPTLLAKELQDKPLDDIKILEIESEDISELVNKCLKELEEVLPELPKACHSLAEIFQSDSPEDGFEPFRQLADIWHNVKIRQQQIVGILSIDTESVKLDDSTLAEMHEELNKFLNEALEALKVCDNVCLGDLLEYELAPRAESEERIVALLRRHAQEFFG